MSLPSLLLHLPPMLVFQAFLLLLLLSCYLLEVERCSDVGLLLSVARRE